MTKAEWERIRGALGESGTAWPTLAVLGLDASLMAVAWWCNRRGTALWVIAAIALQTLAMVHCYLIHHEAVHKAVFRSARGNAWLGHALGWILAFPFLPRQRSHALHHTWTGHPDGDPANRRAIDRFGSLDTLTARRIERLWRLWFPFLVLNDRVGLWREPFRGRREDPLSARFREEVRWVWVYLTGYAVAAAALLASGALVPALRLYLPALALTLCVEELVNLPHHAETPLIDSDRPLPLWEQARVTHECRAVPLWSAFALLHFNIHIAHHHFPWLPWYRLPEARRQSSHDAPGQAAPLESEIRWSVTRRRRPFLEVMGHYFILEARKRSLIPGRP